MRRWLIVILIFSILNSVGFYFAASAATINVTAIVPESSTRTVFNSSSGGTDTLTNANNTTVVFNFPVNFYTEDLRLQASSYSEGFFSSSKPAVSGKSFVGKTFNFDLYTTNDVQVSTISAPVTITISYTDDDISGINESTLAPYHWSSSDSSWQLISGATVNTSNKEVTFSTADFSSFTLFGSPAQQQQQQGGGGGGGDGGGGSTITTTGTGGSTFSGRAYPGRAVTVLKDAQIAGTTIAGSDATFSISVSNLTPGNYIFSLYSEDRQGVRSALSTFPLTITAGTITGVLGIFIAPSLELDKSEVKRGENIAIFGQTAPSADVTIQIAGSPDFFARAVSDKDGIYLHNFNTAVLDYGTHFAKSSSAIGALSVSGFSRAISFAVSTRTVLKTLPTTEKKGDLNNDSKVSLVDFSIAAFWYRRPNPPSHIDLNGDGIVNLVDFSIMAFNWTG